MILILYTSYIYVFFVWLKYKTYLKKNRSFIFIITRL